MRIDAEDRIAADTLGESVLVVGADEAGSAVASQVAADTVVATDTAPTPDAVVVAANASRLADAGAPKLSSIPDAAIRLAVVIVPSRPMAGEREVLDALEPHVDAAVLGSGGGVDDLRTAVETLVSIVRGSGIVNVDLADVKTVFRPVYLASLGVGVGSIDDPEATVRDAFASLPRGIETDTGCGVLVDLTGPPEMSVTDVNETVSTVRGRVGPDAHVIWGGAVDPDAGKTLEVRLVFAGVENVRAAPGDDCPRCGTALSSYTLGDRTMVSCDSCGFAGVSVRLRG